MKALIRSYDKSCNFSPIRNENSFKVSEAGRAPDKNMLLLESCVAAKIMDTQTCKKSIKLSKEIKRMRGLVEVFLH